MLVIGDRRTIGRSEEAAALIRRNPKRISKLMECLWDEDAGVRMRAADALEKLSRECAAWLEPYKAALVDLLAASTQKEVRWHLALAVPRVRLTGTEARRVAKLLESYFDDRSSIVKTFAMQGLADLTVPHPDLFPKVVEIIRLLTRTGAPAMRARGRILLKQFESRPL